MIDVHTAGVCFHIFIQFGIAIERKRFVSEDNFFSNLSRKIVHV